MTTLSTATAVPFRENRSLHRLCLAFGLWLIYTALHAESTFDFWLENVLTLAFGAILAVTYRKLALSDLSYLLIFAFLALHEWGSECKYSDVPIGEWLKEAFGLTAEPLRPRHPFRVWPDAGVSDAGVVRAERRCGGGFRAFLPIQFTLACSGVYEMMEAFMAAHSIAGAGRRIRGDAGRYLGRAAGYVPGDTGGR